MERNIICIVSPQSIDKSALISLPMFRKLAGNFKKFGRITAGTKISDRETASLKLALMPWTPHKTFVHCHINKGTGEKNIIVNY